MVILEGLVENLLELWCQEGYKDVIYGVSNHKKRHQSSMCYVISVFLTVPLFGQQCVIGVFPDHTHVFLFFIKLYTRQPDWKNLVQLFNAESHAIGIKPVHGIDDAIAKYVFDKFVKINGYVYVPDNIDTE